MLDDLYQSDTDAAIGDLIARPPAPRPQAAKFSVWETVKGAGRGLAAGGLEAGAAVPDIAANIGARFTRAATAMLPEPRAAGGREFFEREASREVDAVSVEGDLLRAGARSMMPDPASAHLAESLTFDLFRFGGKAVGYTVAAGPLGGALFTGLDEGLTASDQLRQQGVDLETRTDAGTVIGAVSGLSVLLPVAGKTAAQTAGLVTLGGPVAFMGQQAAVREILQNADYSKLADQYDPFDPVGLAVSTLVPAGFGAFAMRGARTRAQAGDTAPEVRADVETVQDAVQTEPATPRPTPEQVDAARVEMLTQHVESTRLTPAEDMAGARAHQDAMTRAMDQLASGERVEVSDVAPVPRVAVTETPEFKAWFGDSRAVTEEGRPQVLYHGTADSFDSFSMSRAGENGQNFGRMIFLTSDAKVASGYSVDLRKSPDHLAAVQREDELSRAYAQSFLAEGKASENTQRLKREYDQAVADRRALDSRINTFQEPTEGANVVPVYASLRNPLEVDAGGRFFFDVHEDAINRAQSGGHDGVIIRNVIDSATTETRAVADVFVAFRPEQVKSAIGNSGRFDPASASLTDSPFDTWAKRVSAAAEESRTTTEATANVQDAPQARPGDAAQPTQAAQPQAADAAGAGAARAGEQGRGGVSAAGGDAAEARLVEQRLSDIAQQFPDLTVQMDGMDQPMRLSDFLEQVKREAAEGTDSDLGGNDAPLMQVAASCFLING